MEKAFLRIVYTLLINKSGNWKKIQFQLVWNIEEQ
jgi:hypothetical protein